MKDVLLTATLVVSLICLAIFILGAGTAMWMTVKVIHACFITLSMIMRGIFGPFFTMITTPCR